MNFFIFLIFILIYNWYNLKLASAFLVIYNMIFLIRHYFIISVSKIILCIITIAVSILMFLFDDIAFLQHKFTVTLLVLYFVTLYNKAFMAYIFHELELQSTNMRLFNSRFARSILFFAVLNEFIIHYYTINIWVYYKVFVVLSLIIIFYSNYLLLRKK